MTEVTLPAGSLLFHGTIEPFEGALEPGIDGVTWFADTPAIAQTYIPRSGLTVYFSTESLVQPSKDKHIQEVQRLVGLNFDLDKVKWGRLGKAQSYAVPDEEPWSTSGIGAQHDLWRAVYDAENEQKALEAERMELAQALRRGDDLGMGMDEARARYVELAREILDKAEDAGAADDAYRANMGAWEREVEKRLFDLGYEPWRRSPGRPGNHSWEFHVSGDTVLGPGGAAEGRLYIARPIRPLKLWSFARGESDLQNLQYHNIEGFQRAKEKGYDGVLIDDFAQSEEWGNYMHLSVGLFPATIDDLDVTVVPATYEEIQTDNYSTEAYPDEVQPYLAGLLPRYRNPQNPSRRSKARRLKAKLNRGQTTDLAALKRKLMR